MQVADVDFVARAPQTREVEEIPQKLIMKSLKNKIPREQFMDMYNIKIGGNRKEEKEKPQKAKRDFFSKPKEKKKPEELEDISETEFI